jgi:hypothetical protein
MTAVSRKIVYSDASVASMSRLTGPERIMQFLRVDNELIVLLLVRKICRIN